MKLLSLVAILSLPFTVRAGIVPFEHQLQCPAPAARLTSAVSVKHAKSSPKHHLDSKWLSAVGTTLCHIPKLMGIADIRLGAVAVSPTSLLWTFPTIDFTQTTSGQKSVTLPTIPIK
jgi:hypothetical protein